MSKNATNITNLGSYNGYLPEYISPISSTIVLFAPGQYALKLKGSGKKSRKMHFNHDKTLHHSPCHNILLVSITCSNSDYVAVYLRNSWHTRNCFTCKSGMMFYRKKITFYPSLLEAFNCCYLCCITEISSQLNVFTAASSTVYLLALQSYSTAMNVIMWLHI